jgi:hypothetical protein
MPNIVFGGSLAIESCTVDLKALVAFTTILANGMPCMRIPLAYYDEKIMLVLVTGDYLTPQQLVIYRSLRQLVYLQ